MFNTCTWEIHIHMKIPKKTEATLGTYDILDKGKKKWVGVLDFRNESGRFTGS